MPKINSPLTFDFTRADGTVLRIEKGENNVDKDVADSAVIKQICGDEVRVPDNEAQNQSPGEPGVKKDVTDPDKLAEDAAAAADAAAKSDPTKNVPTKG